SHSPASPEADAGFCMRYPPLAQSARSAWTRSARKGRQPEQSRICEHSSVTQESANQKSSESILRRWSTRPMQRDSHCLGGGCVATVKNFVPSSTVRGSLCYPALLRHQSCG